MINRGQWPAEQLLENNREREYLFCQFHNASFLFTPIFILMIIIRKWSLYQVMSLELVSLTCFEITILITNLSFPNSFFLCLIWSSTSYFNNTFTYHCMKIWYFFLIASIFCPLDLFLQIGSKKLKFFQMFYVFHGNNKYLTRIWT